MEANFTQRLRNASNRAGKSSLGKRLCSASSFSSAALLSPASRKRKISSKPCSSDGNAAGADLLIFAADVSANRQEPAVAAAPPPAMPAPAPIVRMAPQGELVRTPASADQALLEKPAAKMSKAAPAALPSLEQGLMEILRLREVGDSKAADEKLLALHKRFPKEDLPARLEALRQR